MRRIINVLVILGVLAFVLAVVPTPASADAPVSGTVSSLVATSAAGLDSLLLPSGTPSWYWLGGSGWPWWGGSGWPWWSGYSWPWWAGMPISQISALTGYTWPGLGAWWWPWWAGWLGW